jgi:hypothetical protein
LKPILKPPYKDNYQNLLNKISQRYIEWQTLAVLSVNESIINTNWNIGEYIAGNNQDKKRNGNCCDTGTANAA